MFPSLKQENGKLSAGALLEYAFVPTGKQLAELQCTRNGSGWQPKQSERCWHGGGHGGPAESRKEIGRAQRVSSVLRFPISTPTPTSVLVHLFTRPSTYALKDPATVA